MSDQETYLRGPSAADDELWSRFAPIFASIADANVERDTRSVPSRLPKESCGRVVEVPSFGFVRWRNDLGGGRRQRAR